MSEISFYPSFADKGRAVELIDVLKAIKDGVFKNDVEILRSLKGTGYKDFKKRLPHFTPSGVFGAARKKEHLISYSQAVVLDIDHLGPDKAKKLRDGMFLFGHCLAAFLSPGGEGLKILVLTDSTLETHGAVFNQVAGFYERALGCIIDRSGKDPTRTCFVSHDPNLWLNEDAVRFRAVQTRLIASKQLISESVPLTAVNDGYPVISKDIDDESLFMKMVDFTGVVDQYVVGNRNNFIFKLACNLNKSGMRKTTAERLLKAKYADLSSEIAQVVHSAYKHTEEHGLYGLDETGSANPSSFAGGFNHRTAKVQSDKDNNPVVNTPLIPNVVYDHLPEILKVSSAVFDIARERDVFLTGALTILSGCFNSVTGIYCKTEYTPNIFSFVIAPPASGKGVLNYSRRLAEAVHERIKDDYKLWGKEKDQLMRSHFIPGDSSAAAIKRLLTQNYGQGTICETEADTMTNALQQDWGNFSDMLRKSFHHEPVSCNRVSNNPEEYNDVTISEIKKPRLSICLSGTPGQVSGLLRSSENGLFSRFVFYSYRTEGEPEFRDVFAKDGIVNLDDYFKEKAQSVLDIYDELAETGVVLFSLTPDQQKRFIKQFDENLKRLNREFGDETRGIIHRLGLITFRIAMILTILRKIEENGLDREIECNDCDFETSMILSDIYLEHSMSVLQAMPGSKRLNPNAVTLLDHLPQEFTYTEAISFGTTVCGYSERTVSYYLKELLRRNYLIKSGSNGQYIKT